MAKRCLTSSPPTIIEMPPPIKKCVCQAVMPKHGSQIPLKIKTTGLQIRSSSSSSSSSFTNKVFEDGSKGIVCYRDDCGEIICEGYDEGPRDAEVVDFLHRDWRLRMANARAHEEAVARDELNFNGAFNSFCDH